MGSSTCSICRRLPWRASHMFQRLQAPGRRFSFLILIASRSPSRRAARRLPQSGCSAPRLEDHTAKQSMTTAPPSASRAVKVSVCAGLFALIAFASPAFAYRPFDGTDAAVADVGEMEIELQPVGRLRQGSDKTLIAPATVF